MFGRTYTKMPFNVMFDRSTIKIPFDISRYVHPIIPTEITPKLNSNSFINNHPLQKKEVIATQSFDEDLLQPG